MQRGAATLFPQDSVRPKKYAIGPCQAPECLLRPKKRSEGADPARGSRPHMEYAIVADQANHRGCGKQRARSPTNVHR